MRPMMEKALYILELLLALLFSFAFIVSKEIMYLIAGVIIAIQSFRLNDAMILNYRLKIAIDQLIKLNQGWIKRAQPKEPTTFYAKEPYDDISSSEH